MTNLTTNDLTDTQVCNLIAYAGTQLNAAINVKIEEENILEISNTKTNTIDGSNKTYYTREYPIGDMDNDMDVDISDITVYQYASDGTKTECTVSSITPNTGEFVLNTAPDAAITKLVVTYVHTQRSVSDPHMLVRMACSLLTAAWAYTKINVGKAPRWRMGSTQIWRDMDSFKTYYDKYQLIVNQINDMSQMDMITSPNVM